MSVKSIKEHERLSPTIFSEEVLIKQKETRGQFCLNCECASDRDKKYFFNWTNGEEGFGYYASYIIGAWNIPVDNEKKPLVVRPKIEDLDFLRMFDLCFKHQLEPNAFKKIYSIDFDQEPIETSEFRSVLSPLIVVHFLSLIDDIVRKGLKKDFINRENNLKKVRGRIDFIRNERRNVMQQRFDRIFCRYQEFSVNTPENRLLKRALLFSQRLLQDPMIADGMKDLQAKTSQYLLTFANVDDNIEVWQINQMRRNKLFSEYDEALQVAKTLLRRYDYNLSQIITSEKKTPAFWIDMSLLYEMYVYALLKERYGNEISYHVRTHSNEVDFVKYDERLIIDTKYISRWGESVNHDNVRQLCGYARNRAIRSNIKAEEQEILPCLILYPSSLGIESFTKNNILEEKRDAIGEYLKFYKLGISLPKINRKH